MNEKPSVGRRLAWWTARWTATTAPLAFLLALVGPLSLPGCAKPSATTDWRVAYDQNRILPLGATAEDLARIAAQTPPEDALAAMTDGGFTIPGRPNVAGVRPVVSAPPTPALPLPSRKPIVADPMKDADLDGLPPLTPIVGRAQTP
ncbi:MAG: hypothetical protein ACRC1K_07665 [Planctomycetia bacterium]